MTATKGIDIYAKNQELADSELVEKYTPLVKKIAWHLMGKLPDSVQIDDLIQAGLIGLLDAARKFEADKGAVFETYASIRIRGSMLDEVRNNDWAPRSVYRNSRRVSEAISVLETKLKRDAKDSEIAVELGVSIEEYHSYLVDSVSTRVFSFDELVQDTGVNIEFSDDSQSSPEEELVEEKFQEALANAINNLPEREKIVLSLYYNEELNLKEIGEILDLSESRVSQIHSQAASRLRARLKEWSFL